MQIATHSKGKGESLRLWPLDSHFKSSNIHISVWKHHRGLHKRIKELACATLIHLSYEGEQPKYLAHVHVMAYFNNKTSGCTGYEFGINYFFQLYNNNRRNTWRSFRPLSLSVCTVHHTNTRSLLWFVNSSHWNVITTHVEWKIHCQFARTRTRCTRARNYATTRPYILVAHAQYTTTCFIPDFLGWLYSFLYEN